MRRATSPNLPSVPEPRCLVIVPVFNESGSIRKVISRLRRALPTFDVLVIDDGSTDDTVRQVPSGVPVLSLPFNLGIGGAMQTGYRYAALHGYDVAVQVDGDGQHRPSEVRRLVQRLASGDVDLVIGSRFLEPTHYKQTFVRRFGSLVLRWIIRVLVGVDMTDCTSGFRAANRKVILAFAHWYPEDYPEPEVVLLLRRVGFRIGELGVRMRHRRTGRSSIGLLQGLFYVMKVTVCLLLDLARDPWPTGKVMWHEPPTELDPADAGERLADPLDRRPAEPLPKPVPADLRYSAPAPGASKAAHV